jgi:hypothetical protein
MRRDNRRMNVSARHCRELGVEATGLLPGPMASRSRTDWMAPVDARIHDPGVPPQVAQSMADGNGSWNQQRGRDDQHDCDDGYVRGHISLTLLR